MEVLEKYEKLFDNVYHVEKLFLPVGVEFLTATPDANAASLHIRWIQWMKDRGWNKGIEYHPATKHHPGMNPFYELSVEEQRKWLLFRNVIKTLTWG